MLTDDGGLDLDSRVRLAAFEFLETVTARYGDALPWDTLRRGFVFEGTTVPLVSPQGIFKPRILPEMPLSIRTAPSHPYEDAIDYEGLLTYKYRDTAPDHPDNLGLRKAMLRRAPLVYLYGLVPGEYLAVWPIFVVADDPTAQEFKVEVDAPEQQWWIQPDGASLWGEGADRRRYITATTMRRLHQVAFRARVLRAYRERCAVCRLGHALLLDAAHILGDKHPRGRPVVSNGLSLCKLHHAAFDRHILGVRPDLVIELRQDILREHDGPMLVHGLQEFQDRSISVPGSPGLQPDKELLEERYELFRKAG